MKRTCILAAVLAVPFLVQSQNVGIGTTTPHGSALLDMQSNSQGLLIPRMTSFERLNLSSPADGLMVYDLSSKSTWLFNGANSQWEENIKTGNPSLSKWTAGFNAVFIDNSADNKVVLVGKNNYSNSSNTMELSGKTGAAGYALYVGSPASNTGAGIYSLHEGTGSAAGFVIANTANTQPALYANSHGAGNAGFFSINNNNSSSDALFVSTNSQGSAGYFASNNSSGTAPSIQAYTTGMGHASQFTINNGFNGNSAVTGTTNGGGAGGRFVNTSGSTGNAGVFEITHVNNISTALVVSTAGAASAATFNISSSSNFFPVIMATTNGTGKSASFSGGSGVEISAVSTGLTHQLILNQQNSSYARLNFRNSTGSAWTIAALRTGSAATDQLNFYNEQVNADRFILYGNGNATLSGTLTQLSDMRLKKNIRPLQQVLPQLKQLQGYTYEWKDDSRSGTVEIGLLAQEVEQVYPQLVRTDASGNKSVAYQNLVPVLLQALKEQQQQIEQLQHTVNRLERQINH